MISLVPSNVDGLDDVARYQLEKLLTVYNLHVGKNAEKMKYYKGKIRRRPTFSAFADSVRFDRLDGDCAPHTRIMIP